jgi:hypothetical protein
MIILPWRRSSISSTVVFICIPFSQAHAIVL